MARCVAERPRRALAAALLALYVLALGCLAGSTVSASSTAISPVRAAIPAATQTVTVTHTMAVTASSAAPAPRAATPLAPRDRRYPNNPRLGRRS